MRELLKYFSFFVLCLVCLTCKKRPTEIKVVVYDPFYDQQIGGSEIAFVEIRQNAVTNEYGCKTLKQVTMNSTGEGFINDAKLKKRDNYAYVLRVSKAYGESVRNKGYCGIRPDDELLPKTNGSIAVKLIYVPPFQTGWAIKIVSLKANGFGSFASDSISVRIFHDFAFVEGWNNINNGSQLNGSKQEVGSLMFKAPTNFDIIKYPESAYFPIFYGKQKVVVYKRKSGIVKDTSYTEIVRHDEHIHEFVVQW